MVRFMMNKNKNELLVLTGAVYSFIAYLTAFTIEVLFIIDLAKQNPAAPDSSFSSTSMLMAITSATATFSDNNDLSTTPISTYDQARLALESMQSHLTISCLAISVLYFLTFVASLLLVVSLILRSAFMLLVWMCSVATLYLPEFGLIIYVSIFGWGIETRNGQTELIFYLLRAALNVIFVYRAHRLWKDWNYEKNFFLFSKSSKRFSAATYDSPYFIHGDSLSTTINPVFSASTLHLDRYDQIRDYNNNNNNITNQSRSDIVPSDESSFETNHQRFRNSYGQLPQRISSAVSSNYNLDDISARRGFYLGNNSTADPVRQNQPTTNRQIGRHNSVLSFDDNDEFEDCEMDLDYRTLTQQRHYSQGGGQLAGSQTNTHRQHGPMVVPTIDYNNHHGNYSRNQPSDLHWPAQSSGHNSAGLSYSTHSLDRRHLNDLELNLPEQVILRPLGHQPFDYLYRPGSSSNLASLSSSNNPNARHHPTFYSSSSRLAKRDDFN